MPVYEYAALNKKGRTKTGVIDAESPAAARKKLRSSNIFPVSIKESSKILEKKLSQSLNFTLFTRVKPAEVAMLTRQLATLVGAGFPLVSALETLTPLSKSQGFKRILTQIKDSIVEGNSFAESLLAYPAVFPPLYSNMVAAGESSGTLEIVLERLAEIYEKQQALKNRIQAALAYPVLMGLIGMVVLFILMTFIVPSISGMFANMNHDLPLPTRVLIQVSDFSKNYWWVVILLAGLSGLALRTFKRTVKGRWIFDRTILMIPLFGQLIKKLAVARFTRTLGSLLENGVTLLTALDIVKNIISNVLLSEAIADAIEAVGKGQGLSEALDEAKVFPVLAIQMILVGEQSGKLEKMLNKIADVYENEVEANVMSMTALLEPLMILVMGVLVGFIVLCICLPIFEINKLVR